MKRILIFLTVLLFSSLCIGQDFKILTFPEKSNGFNSEIMHEVDEFFISYRNSKSDFTQKTLIIEPPCKEKDYPISPSIIYKNNIVSLFKGYGFVCLDLENFSRNINLEAKLNIKEFDYHLLIDNKLHAFLDSSLWCLDSLNQWEKVDYHLPFNIKTKLYDNNSYIVYGDCHGEYGGTVYFYNRKTKETYFAITKSCPKTVIETFDSYKVLSYSNCGSDGHTELILIKDPTELKKLTETIQEELNTRGQITLEDLNRMSMIRHKKRRNKRNNRENTESKENVSVTQPIKIFHYYSHFHFPTTFNLSEKDYYLANYYKDKSFLATLNNDTISVIEPLLNNMLNTNVIATTQYNNNLVLLNLASWRIGKGKETGLILIKDEEIINLEWNNEH